MKLTKTRSVTTVGAVLTLGLTGMGAYAYADPATADPADVTTAVTEAFVTAKAADARAGYGMSAKAELEPLVETKRTSSDGDWVFGGAAFLMPDDSHGSPVTSLFFAHRTETGWEVSLKGTGEFAEAARSAPDDILVDSGERASLAATSETAEAYEPGTPTGLALPWKEDSQYGWRHWGVHGDDGWSHPFNSIDFTGGDGRVGASADGYIYRFCGTDTPLVQVHHDNGWIIDYYHIREQTTVPDGSRVAMYEYLGRTGEQLPCGGSANGNHVHWSLWSADDEPVAVDGLDIGGWTWHEGAYNYYGWATHENRSVPSKDCCLINYGPTAPPES